MSSALFKSLQNIKLSEEKVAELWQEYGVERATVVIDSTGFSRVTQEKGILYFLQLISQMRDIFASCFEPAIRYRFEADNSYAEFKTADEAFIAVKACNQALHDAGLELLLSEPFTVCTGIGFGRLLDSGEEGVYGDEMNLASKLGEDTAEGREILLTQSAFENLSPENRKDFSICDINVSGVSIHYHKFVFNPASSS